MTEPEPNCHRACLSAAASSPRLPVLFASSCQQPASVEPPTDTHPLDITRFPGRTSSSVQLARLRRCLVLVDPSCPRQSIVLPSCGALFRCPALLGEQLGPGRNDEETIRNNSANSVPSLCTMPSDHTLMSAGLQRERDLLSDSPVMRRVCEDGVRCSRLKQKRRRLSKQRSKPWRHCWRCHRWRGGHRSHHLSRVEVLHEGQEETI